MTNTARVSRLTEVKKRPEPAALMTPPATAPARKQRRRRNRRWEKANPARAYRIPKELHNELKRIKAEVMAGGDFRTTVDLVAESIIDAGIAAYARGEAEIYGREISRATRRSPAQEAKSR